jgi:hypothetical protein
MGAVAVHFQSVCEIPSVWPSHCLYYCDYSLLGIQWRLNDTLADPDFADDICLFSSRF